MPGDTKDVAAGENVVPAARTGATAPTAGGDGHDAAAAAQAAAPLWQTTQPQAHALRIMDDLGEIGEGFCKAHAVTAENGQEYIAKGPTLQPDHFYAAANEYIAYVLGSRLGLSMLNATLLQAGDDFYFGSPYMLKGSWRDRMDPALFRRCGNLDQVYGLVAFDVWLYNFDRHEGNLLCRQIPRTGAWMMLLNDHSHCLMAPAETPASLAARVAGGRPPELVKLPYVREEVRSLDRLKQAVGKVESLTDTTIGTVVASLPTKLLPLQERADVVRFICTRRDTLRATIAADQGYFMNLERGKL